MKSVSEAIADHRAAVIADEASYDDDGNMINEELAAQTDAEERTALNSFLTAPCLSLDDVQKKVRYLLEPPVGNREANANRLMPGDGLSWDIDKGPFETVTFLRSLIISGGPLGLTSAAT